MNKNDKDLHGTFGAKMKAPVHQDYAVEADTARGLMADLRAALMPSQTARRLIDMADEQGVVTQFIRGREETAYVPEFKTVFITITPQTRATPRLALMYAGALREAEQNILGLKRLGPEADDDTWMTQHAVKNVDVIKYVCWIVRDIMELNPESTEFLDTLTTFGHNEIYKALTDGASDEDLLRLYAHQGSINIKEG